jgi:SAM-dependent methyltransferase
MNAPAEAVQAYERLSAVYDLWLSGDPAADPCLEFYRGALGDTAADVLELGCGTGRISLALATDGRRVVGLDGSESMLERARRGLAEHPAPRGSASFVNGTFECLPFEDGAFDAVLLPMRTVGHLLSQRDRTSCAAEVVRVLRPGGAFMLDHYQLDRDWADAHDGVPRLMYSGVGATPDVALNVWDRYEYDFEAESLRCTVRIQACPFSGSGMTTEDIVFDFRWFPVGDLEALGRRAGLVVESIWGGFSGEPYDEDADDIVFVFRKPSDGVVGA